MNSPASTPAPSTSNWTSTTTIDALAAALKSPDARRIAVVTHAKPDGDAIGSVMSIARSLSRIGKHVEAWFVGPMPRWAGAMLASSTPVTVREFAPGQQASPIDGKPLGDIDLAVVVDTGSWSQLADVRSWLEPRSATTLLLDHHLNGDVAVSTRRVIDSRCASATQVIAPLCQKLLDKHSATELPLDVAEPLYLGLATDTGWFRYSNVTPDTLRTAADLMQAGVDHTRLYALIEQQDVPARWKLLGRALNTLSLHDRDQIATMSLRDQDFLETGATRNDTGGFADMALTIASVRVSAVLVENPPEPRTPPLTKISLRSKPGDKAVDVNQVASRVGGGGHARAAGAKTSHGVAEAQAILLEAIRAEISR